ncbi:MAG: hypothetical protein AAFN17_06485 [Pseudomonadota bacterium]
MTAPAPPSAAVAEALKAAEGAASGTILHASAVTLGSRGLLFLGPAGSGKTRLALELLTMGAALDVALVADDRTVVTAPPKRAAIAHRAPILRPAPSLAGLVEIRGAGVLSHPYRPEARCWLAVLLGPAAPGAEAPRMPEPRSIRLAGCAVPLMTMAGGLHSAALLTILRRGLLPDPVYPPARALQRDQAGRLTAARPEQA